MTLVKMTETRMGSEDGFVVSQFKEGETYSVRENLARRFFADGYARYLTFTELAEWYLKNSQSSEGILNDAKDSAIDSLNKMVAQNIAASQSEVVVDLVDGVKTFLGSPADTKNLINKLKL